MTLNISGRKIGKKFRPYIIAEMSANHNGDIEHAKKIITAAQKTGADAIKLQTYTADTITLKSNSRDFQITDGLWAGKSLYDLYELAHTPWDWHADLFSHAKDVGITMFSSPFDATAVDLLEDLGAPAYKIASFEAIDIPLIRLVASKNKPVIISTGMADLSEIEEAFKTARKAGCEELALLHCVSGYPAKPSDYNLATLADIARKFDVPVGLSDHTLSNVTSVAAIALGASIIEKHFTLDRNGGGPDDSFSLEPSEFEELCDDAFTAWVAMGQVDYGLKSSERSNIIFRRSLYAVQDIVKGELLTENNVKSIRPGYGLAPKHLDDVIGSVASKNIKRSSPISWDLIGEK